jgi:hypothetical protein
MMNRHDRLYSNGAETGHHLCDRRHTSNILDIHTNYALASRRVMPLLVAVRLHRTDVLTAVLYIIVL